MCRPLSRAFIVYMLATILTLQCQQHCVSAELFLADDDLDDGDVEEYDVDLDDVFAVTGSDGNRPITRSKRSQQKDSWESRLAELELKIVETERKVKELQRFASIYQQEDCDGCKCPTGSVKYGEDCLMYVHGNSTWEEAVQYCAGMMGKLVTIKNKRMQRAIRTFLEKQLGREGIKQVRIYTGLIYTNSTYLKPVYSGGSIGGSGHADGWYWRDLVNVTKLHQDDFHYWDEGQARAANATTNVFEGSCMQLEWNRGLRWRTTHCNQHRHFICHFAATPDRGSRKRSRSGSSKSRKSRNKRKHRNSRRERKTGKRREEKRDNGG